MAEEGKVKFGEAEVSLAQLADVNLAGVKEERFTSWPRLTGVFVVSGEDGPPKLEVLGDKAGVAFIMICEQVVTVKDPLEVPDPTTWIGKKYRETFFLGTDKDFGYLVAFLNDIGVGQNAKLSELLLASVGRRFQASITRRKNPNDDDKPYINFNREKGKIIALAPGQAAKVA